MTKDYILKFHIHKFTLFYIIQIQKYLHQATFLSKSYNMVLKKILNFNYHQF